MSLRTVVLALLLSVALPAAAEPVPPRIADAQVDYSPARADRFTFRFRAGNETLALSIERHTRIERELSPYSANVARGDDRYFRGRIPGRKDSWARLARVAGGWIGAVWDGNTLWLLDPAAKHGEAARDAGIDANATVVFSATDVDLPHGFDPAGVRPSIPPADGENATADLESQPRGINRFLKVTLVLDTEFQTLNGGNSASVAGAVLNIVDGFYSNQVGVDVSLFHLRALASNGPMTSSDSSVLLESQFAPWVGGGNVPIGGVTHLLSGKDFNGNTVGLAYVGTVCNTSGFATGIDQITFSNAFGGATLAHEIGHNFNADHDSDGNACPASGFIMAAIINIGTPANQFSSCSLNYFSTYLQNALTCLNGAPDLIFKNGFQVFVP